VVGKAEKTGSMIVKPHVMVYVTVPNSQEATTIAATVVNEKLAACAGTVNNVHSLYWWQGLVQSAEEHLLIFKTTGECFHKLVARVKELHSYKVPEIIALPIIDGNAEYLEWITTSVE
jgi:periplasmic divalent cation tolerance protein